MNVYGQLEPRQSEQALRAQLQGQLAAANVAPKSSMQTDAMSAADTAQAIRECILTANAVIEELADGPRPEKSNSVPIQFGLMETLEQTLAAANLLRERVVDLKQRIGRL